MIERRLDRQNGAAGVARMAHQAGKACGRAAIGGGGIGNVVRVKDQPARIGDQIIDDAAQRQHALLGLLDRHAMQIGAVGKAAIDAIQPSPGGAEGPRHQRPGAEGSGIVGIGEIGRPAPPRQAGQKGLVAGDVALQRIAILVAQIGVGKGVATQFVAALQQFGAALRADQGPVGFALPGEATGDVERAARVAAFQNGSAGAERGVGHIVKGEADNGRGCRHHDLRTGQGFDQPVGQATGKVIDAGAQARHGQPPHYGLRDGWHEPTPAGRRPAAASRTARTAGRTTARHRLRRTRFRRRR